MDGKIKRLTEDRDVVDKSIANTKSIMVGGKIDVTIKADPLPTRSDEHVQKVAAIVGSIVDNVVLSDDFAQICMTTLQTSATNEQEQKFAAWCLDELTTRTLAKKSYLHALNERQKALDVKPVDGADAKKEQDSLISEFQRLTKPDNVYTVPKWIDIPAAQDNPQPTKTKARQK